jgi:pyruvate, water dikinase
MSQCTWLEDALDREQYGGKAASLAVALRAGLSVPWGVALSWSTVDAIASGNSGSICGVVAELEARLGSGRVLAVRSSAVGEDSAGASFAGIHESVLGVREAGQLSEAIMAVWRSARSPAAMSYRQQRGITGAPRIAVVLQACVDADTAGVMFTCCPVTGADERVIEGAWGLGDVVVSGLVTPDTYRIARDGTVIERTPGEKAFVRRLAAESLTSEGSVPAEDIDRLCLDDDQLRELHVLAERCDHVYGSRLHDIEWAFQGGEVYLLQRRPITHAA